MLSLLIGLSLLLPCLAFSAEDMLSAPRPHAPVLSPSRSLALNVVDQWDPKDDKMSRSLYLLNLTSSSQRRLLLTTPTEVSEVFWISDEIFGHINGTSIHSTFLNGTKHKTSHLNFTLSSVEYHPHTHKLYFTAQVWEGSRLEDVQRDDKAYEARGFDGEVYDELFIRHWDTWRIPGKVWTVGSINVFTGEHKDLLKDTGYYQKMDPPSFTLSKTHLALTLKPNHLNYATHTRTDIVLLPLKGGSATHLTPHRHGAISGVTFDETGHRVFWLEMEEDGYEADQNKVQARKTKSGKWDDIKVDPIPKWDKSPSAIKTLPGSQTIALTAEWHGRTRPLVLTDKGYKELQSDGSITSIQAISADLLLLTGSSFTGPAESSIMNITSGASIPLTAWSKPLTEVKAEEFWFKGADGWDVMAWIIRPPAAKIAKNGKVPMAFLIHGGPQGAWEDMWSTRWNHALFAEKGFFVVAINPTGSTGYGQEFTDRIQYNWGSRPFKDLLAGYHAVLKAFPEIDTERTAALGASYGGYMANWIQGHNDQFGFKAIVCHDGIFDTATSYYTTEEVWFPTHEFGDGMSGAATYQKWNPMNHVAEWNTPELVIHGGKDYRLVASQGIAAFTALQTRGVPSRFLYFPNENHWVLSPKNSMKWHYEVFMWLDEWVGEKRIAPGSVGSQVVLGQ